MEKIVGRYGKVHKMNKEPKSTSRESRKLKISELNHAFPGLKRLRKARDDGVRGPRKITSARLTIRRGIFENALRSDIIGKAQLTTIKEESNALLNEDLFKIIDLGCKTSNKYSKDQIVAPFLDENHIEPLPAFLPTIINQIDEKTDQTHSIFCDIEQNYKQLLNNNNNYLYDFNENYLINQQDLSSLIYERFSTEFLSPWSIRFKQFLDRLKTDDYNKVLATQIIQDQKSLNTLSVVDELSRKFQGIPVADNCLRRKFTRAYNNLVELQAMDSKKIINSEALDMMQQLQDAEGDSDCTQMEMSVDRCTTPDNQPIVFPDESYHTPENQKYVYRLPESTKLQTGIYVVPNDYKSSLRDISTLCEPPNLESAAQRPVLFELDETERVNKSLLAQLGVSRNEQRKIFDFDTNPSGYESVHQRPKKMFKSERHSFGSSYFGGFEDGSSPEDSRSESRRKLNYPSLPLFDPDAKGADSLYPGSVPQSVFRGFAKPKKSPKIEYCRLSIASGGKRGNLSPNEYSLRKKYAPHTVKIEAGEGLPPVEAMEALPAPASPSNVFFPRLHN